MGTTMSSRADSAGEEAQSVINMNVEGSLPLAENHTLMLHGQLVDDANTKRSLRRRPRGPMRQPGPRSSCADGPCGPGVGGPKPEKGGHDQPREKETKSLGVRGQLPALELAVHAAANVLGV